MTQLLPIQVFGRKLRLTQHRDRLPRVGVLAVRDEQMQSVAVGGAGHGPVAGVFQPLPRVASGDLTAPFEAATAGLEAVGAGLGVDFAVAVWAWMSPDKIAVTARTVTAFRL
jgi:hypothetical protein